MTILSDFGQNVHRSKEDLLRTYCERGWKLLPIWEIDATGNCACGKRPCGDDNDSAGKHPVGGLVGNWREHATCDFNVVSAWHRARPTANWGWAFDREWVLDVDPRNGFSLDDFDSWGMLFDFDLPPTLIQRSGGSGLHVVFSQVDGRTISNGSVKFQDRKIKGLDVKGVGGYILVEPSNHLSGGSYRWTTDLASTGVAEPPAELLGMLSRGGSDSGPREPVNVDAIFAGVEKGSRDITIRDYIRSMRSRRFKYVEAMAMLEIVCARMEPPFDIDNAVYKLNRCWDRFEEGQVAPPLADGHKTFIDNAVKKWTMK